MLKAVIFDVDFTLARPGPELGPEGYRKVGERHGLALDPELYEGARLDALDSLQRHPDHEHDDELWIAFTEQIVRGMGGDGEGARACAEELVRAWEQHERFTLYEDALPALAALREHGVKIGLISNGSRDLEEFVSHHGLDADCAIGSRAFGRTKPHPEIFRHALELLGVEPAEAAMIGDSYEDDIEGARALGMKAFLLDRDGRRPDEPDRLPDLFALPAALGLTSTLTVGRRLAGAQRLDVGAAAAPGEPDPQRGVVVGVVDLLQPLTRVGAVDEEVDPGRDAAQLEVLAVEVGGVQIREADRRSLLDRERAAGSTPHSCRRSGRP